MVHLSEGSAQLGELLMRVESIISVMVIESMSNGVVDRPESLYAVSTPSHMISTYLKFAVAVAAA
jgi:hypothetical protein